MSPPSAVTGASAEGAVCHVEAVDGHSGQQCGSRKKELLCAGFAKLSRHTRPGAVNVGAREQRPCEGVGTHRRG